MGKVVAIVGRPNVGKSTLFNRLVGGRQAIVDNTSGVTRDRHYGSSDWNGVEFTVIDTGGYVDGSDDVFESEIRKQVLIALEECDLVLLMADAQTGITSEDDRFAQILRKVDKPMLVVANKADNHMAMADANEFYRFGLGEVFALSSISGTGTGELLDEVARILKETEDAEEKPELDLPKFAVLGKPNVGKSTIVNAWLGKDRNIVADIPGTTRDSIYTRYNQYGKDFYLIDTAGLRKKKSVHEDIEFYSVMRAIRALEDSDVAFIMIDGQEGIQAQDMNILGLAIKRKKGVVMLVNKWDAVQKDHNSAKKLEDEIRSKTAPFVDYPILFISALNKQRIFQALEEGLKVEENRKRRITTSKLNDLLRQAYERHPAPSHGGKHIKINYVTQLPTPTPVFAFFCNHPELVKESYRRYLENELRKAFDFGGCPIKLVFKKK